MYKNSPKQIIGLPQLEIKRKKAQFNMKDEIEELTLLLLYLTSFKEDIGLGEVLRSWKGYPFESLNELSDNEYIHDSKRSKSVYLTDKGIEQAKELMKKYNIKQQ